MKTPGSPIFGIACPVNKDEEISPNKQGQCCSGVGMFFYLVKHSHQDIANVNRELSKVLDQRQNYRLIEPPLWLITANFYSNLN